MLNNDKIQKQSYVRFGALRCGGIQGSKVQLTTEAQ